MYEFVKIFSLTLPLLLPGLILIFVLKKKLFKFLDYPLDFRLSMNGKRIFGDNKRFKGAVTMILAAIFVSYVLHLGYGGGYDKFINPAFSKPPILIGLLYSISYVFGELANSFIKRRTNIASGKITSSKFSGIQVFFDLSDGIITTAAALILFASVSVLHAFIAGLIGIFIHYSTDILMKKLSLK